MEETMHYKEDIAATRVGCLGSSDGKLIAQVAAMGCVPKSAHKRLAVVNGLIRQQEIPKTAAVQAGDDVEMMVFNNLKSQDPRYESNPYWESKKYSRKNVKLISHPDLVLQDDSRKVLNIYEVKTTKYDVPQTLQTYKAQLYIHYILGIEKARALGTGWTVKVYLVHYNTEGLDLSSGVTFDASRLTLKPVTFSHNFIDVPTAMDVINAFLETYTEYYEGDEVDYQYLPPAVKNQFDDIECMLEEIKERENKVNEFKKRLYEFMKEKNIKSIKNDVFSITRVDDTESKTFDSKRYLEDMKAAHPYKTKKIIKQYTKVVKRGGYAAIKLFDNKT